MRTTNTPARQLHRDGRSRPGKVLHLFDRQALEFARAHRLQIKAFCGRWVTPRTDGRSITDADELAHERLCQSCTRVLRSRIGGPR